MLNPRETQSLIEVISDPSQTFEQFIQSFQKTFSKTQHFRAGRTLCYMMDEDLLNKTQRIQTIYLLYHKKDKDNATPFYAMLLRLCDELNYIDEFYRSKAERRILIDCLTTNPKLGSKVISEWIEVIEKQEDTHMSENIDVTPYSKAYFQSMPQLEGFEAMSLNPIVRDEKQKDYVEYKTIEKDKMLNLVVSDSVNEEISTPALVPNFLRPTPEVDQDLEDSIVKDAIWLFPGVLPEPCWDYTLGNNTSKVKKLMKNSVSGTLKQSCSDLIAKTFKADPESVLHYGIHCEDLSKLIIHNKDLAMEFLNAMSPYTLISEYYDDLAQTKVNLNSMELFNKIAQDHVLPKEYILIYINN